MLLIAGTIIIFGIIPFFFLWYLISNDASRWKRIIGAYSFIVFTLFAIGIGVYFGKEQFYGAAVAFDNLSKDREYQIVKILDDNYSIVKITSGINTGRQIIVKGLPKEIKELKEGRFEIKDVPSVTTSGKFITPMLHVQ